jgi:hypothetical protein
MWIGGLRARRSSDSEGVRSAALAVGAHPRFERPIDLEFLAGEGEARGSSFSRRSELERRFASGEAAKILLCPLDGILSDRS